MRNSSVTIYQKVTDTANGRSISSLKIFNKIKSGYWKDEVMKCRAVRNDKKKYNKIRTESIPAVTFGGEFTHRKEKGLNKHSGLICIDIDEEDQGSDFNADECRNRLSKLPFVVFVARSIGGGGVFAVCRVNPCSPDDHKMYYDALADVVKSKLNIISKVDPQPKNVASLRYISYDPEAYINPNATIFEAKKKREQRVRFQPLRGYRELNIGATESKIIRLVTEIEQRRIEIVPTYHEYVRLAFAFADELGEAGRDYFHRVCESSPKYNEADAEKKYNHALQASNGSIGIGTFFKYCKDAGLDVSNHEGERHTPYVSDYFCESVLTELEVEINSKPKIKSKVISKPLFTPPKPKPDLTAKTLVFRLEDLAEGIIQPIRTDK